ncbi:MAG: Uma2 family endonuclease [Gemmataceae bacterium]
MPAALESRPHTDETLADLLKRLGGISPHRVLMHPHPGTATEKDVIKALEADRKRICELVEGVLVEKVVGTKESLLGCTLIQIILNFLDKTDLGIVIGADGPLRILRKLVRIPDVSFISWDRLPEGRLPDRPIANIVPDLAIEILSKGNTPREMARKIREYFKAGVRLVWLIDEKKQQAEVYTSPQHVKRIDKTGDLEGGEVLPGFRVSLADLFSRGQRRGQKR